MQLRARFFEFLVFDKLPDQFPTRVIFLRIFLGRQLIDRQQAAAFQVNQVCRHRDELAGEIDVQFRESLKMFEVLASDTFNRDVVNIDLVALDQVKQEIERPFENLQLDLVIALHASRPTLGKRRGKVNQRTGRWSM